MMFARPMTNEEKSIARKWMESQWGRDKRVHSRIEIIEMSISGYSARQIAYRLNIGVTSIRKWISLYNKHGIMGLKMVIPRRPGNKYEAKGVYERLLYNHLRSEHVQNPRILY